LYIDSRKPGNDWIYFHCLLEARFEIWGNRLSFHPLSFYLKIVLSLTSPLYNSTSMLVQGPWWPPL
jgi:hypothetical protein